MQPTSTRPAAGWLVGPAFDLLFLANVLWPLAAVAGASEAFGGRHALSFWQLYYVTTPHRWITLFVVLLDPSAMKGRVPLVVGTLAAVVVLCLTVRVATGALTCLLAVDYVWNAWHFAAQHHGVYRVYERNGGARDFRAWEKWPLRLFLLYVILRVAVATWPDDAARSYLGRLDIAAVAVPVLLVARALTRPHRTTAGVVYLLSVCLLYLSLLWSVHDRRPGLVLALATASALFHATEYLALVGWSVRKRHAANGSEMGMLGAMVPRWGLALAAFVVVLGAGGVWMDHRAAEVWLTMNVVAAFLHYAYDGLIWRHRPAVPGATT